MKSDNEKWLREYDDFLERLRNNNFLIQERVEFDTYYNTYKEEFEKVNEYYYDMLNFNDNPINYAVGMRIKQKIKLDLYVPKWRSTVHDFTEKIYNDYKKDDLKYAAHTKAKNEFDFNHQEIHILKSILEKWTFNDK